MRITCTHAAQQARRHGQVLILGQLLHPAQDCALRYGHALVLNRIEELSESDRYARIGPEWQPRNLCTHTYRRTEDFEVVDGMFVGRDLRWLSSDGMES